MSKKLPFWAARLAYWRERRNLTQEQLAVLAKVSNATISRIENGKNFYSGKSLAKLANALQITQQELAEEQRESEPELVEIKSIIDGMDPSERRRLIAMMRAFAGPRKGI